MTIARLALLSTALAAACAAPAEETLLVDIPRSEDLAVPVAALAGPDALSPLYVATRRVAGTLNGMVKETFDDLWDVTRTPPTVEADGRAVWGPFTDPLSPVVRLLIVEPTPEGVRFVLQAAPRDGSAGFAPVVTGAAGPAGGVVAIDLTLARALDPAGGWAQDGNVVLGFGRSDAGTSVEVGVDGAAEDLAYSFVATPSGGGELFFAARLDGDGAGDGGGAPRAIHTRFQPSGAGRADAVDGGAPRSECWDARFQLVFLATREGVQGDLAACAFPRTDE